MPKWLEEAGVIAFLDILLAAEGTTPEVRQRAKELRSWIGFHHDR